jgi:2-polyprenyl-3-methyl-5-hydroxy-6-metoxy-1,4-benzoquinol methylase
MRTNPRPTVDTIDYYYPAHYSPYKNTRIADIERKRSGIVLLNLIKKFFKFHTHEIPELNPGRMLEVGCASGSFLHCMHQKGWEVVGIESSRKAAEEARLKGYSVHHDPLEKVHAIENKFDLIVGWMVLEHLHDPITGLRNLYDWIHPDGWFAFSVPNAGASEFGIFKDKWYALQVPNHLYHYTPQTIRLILEKTGWKVVKIFHQRTLSNLIASLGFALKDLKMTPTLASKMIAYPETSATMQYLLYPMALLLSVMGQTGRMTVWARP